MNLNKPFFLKGKRHRDHRGFFQEIYLQKKFKIPIIFTAVAHSKKNVIRGLHFQYPNKQIKIIHVIEGKILDVVVDIQQTSKTFGKTFKYYLQEGDSLVVPNNYAHGYECISKYCKVLYHLDGYRKIKSENGINFDDKELAIKWQSKKPIVSNRDKNNLSFEEFKKKNYIFR